MLASVRWGPPVDGRLPVPPSPLQSVDNVALDTPGLLFQFVHIVAGDQHRHPLFTVYILDELQVIAFASTSTPIGRLVEKEDLGCMQSASAQIGAHLLPQAQLPRQGDEELVDLPAPSGPA